jgi:tRNA(Ile)-lysidine synthase
MPEGPILRPLLNTTRSEIETYLAALGQSWREDSSNRHLSFTRNRIRHELLPLLEGWNPHLREHLAQIATLARDEEAWWAAELDRLAPQILLPGRPVRGGGRAAGVGGAPSLAIDVTRLTPLAPALQRRLLRRATSQLGAALDFEATESLRFLVLTGRASQKLEFADGLHAERTPRELRLSREPAAKPASSLSEPPPEYRGAIPGRIDAPAFGLRLLIENLPGGDSTPPGTAVLRNWKAGDRVTLRYSSGPRKVKEVLERLKVTGSNRALWPVLEIDGRVLWMRGAELQPEPGIKITAESVEDPDSAR